MYYVYIFECLNKTFYTGIKIDLKRLVEEQIISSWAHATQLPGDQ